MLGQVLAFIKASKPQPQISFDKRCCKWVLLKKRKKEKEKKKLYSDINHCYHIEWYLVTRVSPSLKCFSKKENTFRGTSISCNQPRTDLSPLISKYSSSYFIYFFISSNLAHVSFIFLCYRLNSWNWYANLRIVFLLKS